MIRFKFTNDWKRFYGIKLCSQNITFLNMTWDFNKHSSFIKITILNFVFLFYK